MKIKISISFFIISLLAVSSAILVNEVFSQETAGDNIQYPVAELGNCTDRDDCKSYCDKPANGQACIAFAEENNLMSEEELKIAKNFIAAGSKGPGDCTSKDSCEEYCNDIQHIDACIAFAEQNNLMSPQELEEARKVQAAIARGIEPPACGSKKACDTYCEDPANMEECIIFAEAAGFLQGEELQDAKKMMQAVKRGVKAPPCKGKTACDEYCSSPSNMEVCMNFAIEAGFMDEQEKADAQKMLQAIKNGITPPNCKGKEECDSYCSQDEHFEECITFAEAAGFMTAEDAVMARKTGGKGPGGCKGKEECEAFCNNPDNQETCFNFAKDNGLISEEDLKNMDQGRQQMQEALQQAPPEVISCLESQIGLDLVEKMKQGTSMPSRELGDKLQECFQSMMPPQGQGAPGQGGIMPPSGQTGPDGCASPEECQAYCQSNPEVCNNFQPPTQPMPGITSTPCEGENCPPSGSGFGPMPPCEGENCFSSPEGVQPYPQQTGFYPQPLEGGTYLEGQYPPPPLSSTYPEGQYSQPPSDYSGELVPIMIQPLEPQPLSPPPEEQPTSFIDLFLGFVLRPFKLLINK